jgi:hypothetical protein
MITHCLLCNQSRKFYILDILDILDIINECLVVFLSAAVDEEVHKEFDELEEHGDRDAEVEGEGAAEGRDERTVRQLEENEIEHGTVFDNQPGHFYQVRQGRS